MSILLFYKEKGNDFAADRTPDSSGRVRREWGPAEGGADKRL